MERIQITAKTKKDKQQRISQCDIFHDIDVVEKVEDRQGILEVTYIHLPLVICLNQDCDLNSDYRDKRMKDSNKNVRLLHLLIAPLFNFDSFKDGSHWDEIFQTGVQINPKKTDGKNIRQNENPRYHYLHFEEDFVLPDMVIDFKHLYSVNTDYLYGKIQNRVCSLSELYREKITQRFANYFSRIGLPD